MKPTFAALILAVLALGFLSLVPIHSLGTVGQNNAAAVLSSLRTNIDRGTYIARTMEGVLEVTHFDDFNSGVNTPIVDLVTKTGTVHVDIGTIDHDALPPSGTTVRIDGSYANNTLKISQLASVKQLSSAPQTPGASLTGSRSNPAPKKISIVLFNYSNDPSQPFTKEDVRKNYFEPNADSGITMSEFLKKSTYDQMSLEGKTSVNGTTDVWGWYTLPITRTHCDSAEELKANGRTAINMAVQAGMQVSSDDIIAVGTFPYSGCTTGGVAYSGDVNGTRYRSIYMSNMLAWGGALHEIAHISKIIPANGSFDVSSFLHHSNAFECLIGGVTVPYGTQGSICTLREYASPFSILGGYTSGAMRTRLMDGQNRIEGGYLGITNIVSGGINGGTYDLTKLNYTDAQLLRIPIYIQPMYVNGVRLSTSVPTYIEVEPRDFMSFEQAADTFPNTDVALIRWREGGGNFSSIIRPKPSSRLLAPGQSFYIPNLGTTITNQGATPGNNHKVRISVAYNSGSITEVDALKITYGSITPQKTTIQSTGIFVHPKLATTITGAQSDIMIFPHNAVRIFPVGGTQPLDHIIMGALNGTDQYGPVSGTQSYNIDVLPGLNITPAQLVGQGRSIYKVMVRIMPFSFSTAMVEVPIYVMYGTFSVQELTNLGIITITPTPAQINLTGTTQATFSRKQ